MHFLYLDMRSVLTHIKKEKVVLYKLWKVTDNGFSKCQSLLLDRHRMRQICEIVNAGMQPLQNLSTLRSLNLPKDKEKEYVEAMMLRGVAALEQLVDESSDFCLGSTLTMADVFFVPQMRNVVDRFKIDVSAYPRVTRLYELLKEHESFKVTHPTVQLLL